MENKKAIRNPFPWIGKVFKYEMKHSERILLPIYIAIVAVALLTGSCAGADGAGGDVCVTETVDYAGCAVQKAYQAAAVIIGAAY